VNYFHELDPEAEGLEHGIKHEMRVIDLEDSQNEFKLAVSLNNNLNMMMLTCNFDRTYLLSTAHFR
jgi:hypothetical protein